MKKNKLFTSVLAAGIALTSAFSVVGCGRPNPDGSHGDSGRADKPYDDTKTQVRIWTYNAGFKDEWLYQLEADFEEANKDTVYEAGKKGVQVRHEGAMKEWSSDDIKNSNFDVFFMEGGDYYAWRQSGALEDITSLVTSNSAYDNKTIRSKMNDKQIAYFGGVTGEGVQEKYYALPHYKGAMGLIYNVEIFDEYGFYISDSETTSLISASNPNKSKGPDGKTGKENGIDYSMDDGLPATYDEFFYLCGQMLKRGVTPFMLPGTYSDYYINILYNALVTEYEGIDQMELNMSFKGNATDLIKLNSDGTAIVKKNGEPVMKDSKYSRQNRKFGWMSLPKANKLKLEEGNSVFLDSLEAAVCVKANLGANKKAALDFVQYVCSDGALDKFTDVTHALKDFNYEVSKETYDNANYFTKTLINYNKTCK